MNYFIIGDVHGCYFTFCKMLEHWDSDQELLVSVGDLIDRGNYSALMVQKCMELSQANNNALFIKGNHEAEFVQHVIYGYNKNWVDQCGQKTLDDFKAAGMELNPIAEWMKAMPLKFESDTLLVSHAGISEIQNPYDENHNDSVLWNRKALKNIGKMQIHGHTPLKRDTPAYTASSNSWNIDTGACYGYGLTALRVNAEGVVTEHLFVKTDPRDMA